MKGTKVVLSKLVKKQVLKLPHHVIKRLDAWVESVASEGVREVRKIPGYHDEALKGKRKGAKIG